MIPMFTPTTHPPNWMEPPPCFAHILILTAEVVMDPERKQTKHLWGSLDKTSVKGQFLSPTPGTSPSNAPPIKEFSGHLRCLVTAQSTATGLLGRFGS